jgi:hypothetical protein
MIKFKIILHSGLIGLLGYLFIGLFSPIANGQTMSNNDYIIIMQGFNVVSGTTTGEGYKLRSTLGGFNPIVSEAVSESEGVNFKAKAGFESLTATLPFSISLSSDIVDFGTLSPTNPIIRTINLSTHSLTVYGYSVLVFENEPLATIPPSSKTFIPDTTCDNGKCDAQNASEWTNALTYGFGYRCDNVTRLPSPGGEATGGQAGMDCDSSFVSPSLYKHFPDVANNDDLQSIMAGIGSSNNEARISYKVNVSETQAQGTYSNIVTYIGVPNF